MTVTELGPTGTVIVAVADFPAESVRVDGVAEPPTLTERVTVPEKPFRLVRVTVNEQNDPRRPPPATQVMLPGAVTLKSWTVNLTVAECVSEPEVPIAVAV